MLEGTEWIRHRAGRAEASSVIQKVASTVLLILGSQPTAPTMDQEVIAICLHAAPSGPRCTTPAGQPCVFTMAEQSPSHLTVGGRH